MHLKESWKTKQSVTLNLDMFHPSQLAELDLQCILVRTSGKVF